MKQHLRIMLAVLLVALGGNILHRQASAATPLESRIASATGIARSTDAGLQARAAVRSIEIQTTFGHCCLAYGEAEVIAWNSGFSDPLAQLVIGWLNSPSHAAVLLDPDYTRIGCATSTTETRTYGVCLFATPVTPGATAAPAPPISTLPDTALPR